MFTWSLTTALDDTIPGLIGSKGTDNTDGNDLIKGVIDVATPANTTLNTTDDINGGDGVDTLLMTVASAISGANKTAVEGLTLASIETLEVRAGANFGVAGVNDLVNDNADDNDGTPTDAIDLSGFGFSTVNVTTAAGDVAFKAKDTANVSVADAKGNIEINGGNDVAINVGTADKHISVGSSVQAAADNTNSAGASPKGTITVTDTNQGAGVIQIDGGTDVTVTASTDKATSGDITVGALDAPTGVVKVTQNLTSDGTAATAGDVTVTGGSKIDITANLTNTAVEGSAGGNITAGTYTATAGDATSEVTIVQNATATDFVGETTGATNETATITFGALKAGESVFISEGAGTKDTDLTFTAAKDLTAEEVAAAFANLTNADTQTPTGPTANGYFTGTLDAGWTSGAVVNGNQVVFTATDTGPQTDLQVGTDDGTGAAVANAADFSVTVVDGSAGTTPTAVNVTADYGNVVVDDNATKSITKITLDGYDGATLGGNSSLDALTDLILKNSSGATTLTTAKTSLNLTVAGMVAGSSVSLDGGSATITDLNLTVEGDSDIDFTVTFPQSLHHLQGETKASYATLNLAANSAGGM